MAVTFPLQAYQLPADHSYGLYAVITQRVPNLHSVPWLGIERISGVPSAPGLITVPTRRASLRLRLPVEKLGQVLPLAGARLEIDGCALRLGIPSARPLLPAASLYARMVTIKKFTEPEPCLAAAQRQLAHLGISGTLELPQDGQTRQRRIVTIHGRKIVGFSCAVHGLNEADSLKLQAVGLGGRRAMGCGIFNPIRRAMWSQERGDAHAVNA
jgi:CRISPR-associated endonuclease/helicase Cas3